MKLERGVGALAVSCVALVVALALWRHSAPQAHDAGSILPDRAEAGPAARADRFPGVLADPLPEAKRTQAIARPAKSSVDLRRVPNEDGVRVCGSVKMASDAPMNARAVLFQKNSSEPDSVPLAEVACDDDGSFCLSTDRAGDFALAVLAPGYRPATRILELSIGTVEDIGVIELDAGAALEGSVQTDGEPTSGVELVAILSSSGPTMRTSDATLRWTRGAFEWSFTSAKDDSDGRYRIAGLRPGDYRVRITSMRGPRAVFGYKTLEAMAVEAPNKGVDFKLATSSVDMHIESDRLPVAAASAELETQGFHLGRTSDERGLVTLKTLPDIECNLIVRKKGYQSRLIPFETPPVGKRRRETIDLEPGAGDPRDEPASMRVELASSTDEPITVADFTFYDVDSSTSAPLFRRWDVRAAPASDGASRDSTFVLEKLASGQYRVVVQAGAQLGKSRSPQLTRFCDQEFEIVVPRSGEISRRFAIETRGSADIAVHAVDGTPLPAQVVLLTTDGDSLPVMGREDNWRERALLGDDGRTRIYAQACGGSFLLEVSYAGYVTRRLPLTLSPGYVSSVDATLEPK